MKWLILAFLTPFFTSLQDVINKKIAQKIDVSVVAWGWTFFSLPILLIFLIWEGIPSLGPLFWPAVFISGFLLTIATLLYIKAIKVSDLSLAVPMLAFTPLFLLITSFLILGEVPKPLGFIGVILIVVGSYVINFKHKKEGYGEPFKNFLKEKGLPRIC